MIPLEPEVIFHLFDFPVTNTILATLVTDVVLLSLVFLVYKHISFVPKGIQNVFEGAITYFYDLTSQIAGEKRAVSIFPWFMSFFLVIFFY